MPSSYFRRRLIAALMLLSATASVTKAADYTTDFNTPPAGWTLDAPVGGVGWAFDNTPSTFPSGISKSGNSLNYNNGTDYAGSNSGGATSPAIPLAGLTNPVLFFWSNYNTETRGTAYDKRTLQIWDGAGTTKLAEWQLATTGYTFDAAGGLVGRGPGPAGEAYYEETEFVDAWHEYKVYLDPAWGTIRVRFHFDTVDNQRNGYAGWAIDDFRVTGHPNPAPVGYPDLFPDTDTRDSDGNELDICTRSSNNLSWAWGASNQGTPGIHFIIGDHPDAILDKSFLHWSPSHQHTHFSQYSDFSLWQMKPGIGFQKLRRSLKRSFLLTDIDSIGPGGHATGPSGSWQAISYNWQDVYSNGTTGQNLDLTGLATGSDFYLIGIVDPINRVRELNNMNNMDQIHFTLPASGQVPLLDRNNPYPQSSTNLTIASATPGTFDGAASVRLIGTGFDSSLMPVLYDAGTAIAEADFYTLVSSTEVWVKVPAAVTTPASIDLLRARGDCASRRIDSGPVVLMKSHLLDDDSVAGTLGNGDGLINPGEKIGLNVTLSNYGSQIANTVSATFSLLVPDANVTILQSTVAYGNLAVGADAAGSGQFLLQIAPATPTPREIRGQFVIQDGAGNTWTSNLNLMVYSSSQVSGRVTLDGAPLPGATVTFTGPLSGTRTTAADGTYLFGAIDGTYSVVVTQGTFLKSATATAVVPPNKTGLDFAFATNTISGTVTLDGAPLSGATVTYSGAFAGTVTSAANGTYSISKGIEAGKSAAFSLIASKSGYLDTNPVAVTLPPSAGNVNFAFTTAVVSGTVTKDGAPLSGATITYSGAFAGTVTSAADGTYSISKVYGRPGTLNLTASMTGFYSSSSVAVTLPPSASNVNFAFTTAVVSGTVTQDGAPLSGATITYSGAFAGTLTSAADGTYSITKGYGRPGTLNLTASMTGFYSSGSVAVTLPPSASNVNFAFTTAVVSGTVTQDGAPLSGATITFSGAFAGTVSSAANGTYSISKVFGRTGTLNLTASMTGFYSSSSVAVTLPPSAGNVNFAFTTATVSGTITDMATGAPLAGASVDYSGAFTGSATTAANGTYSIAKVYGRPGTLSLIARKTGYTNSAAQSVTLPPNATKNIALGFPNIAVTPASLSQVLRTGRTATQTLNLSNTGSLPLNWSTQTGVDGGFTVADSDVAGGPVYSWIEISATGTRFMGLGDDLNVGPFNIGFAFPFYGQSFTTFRLCTNGWLSFTSTSTALTNTTLPNASAPENLIAFFWDDLNFNTGGAAYYQLVDANTLVVEFDDVPFYVDSTQHITCQAILKSDGTIYFQYKHVVITGASTIGVQNALKNRGTQVAYNLDYVHADMAVRLVPTSKWLTVAPGAGTTSPSASAAPVATFDATGMLPGTYTTTLVIASNDIETPSVNVPVTLVVKGLERSDVSGDGKADILFRHPSSGEVRVWLMN